MLDTTQQVVERKRKHILNVIEQVGAVQSGLLLVFGTIISPLSAHFFQVELALSSQKDKTLPSRAKRGNESTQDKESPSKEERSQLFDDLDGSEKN